MPEKEEGFMGQKALVLPKSVEHACKSNAIISPLFITHIGYYPNAEGHSRVRPKGAKQHILIYCTSGSGFVSIEGKEYPVKAGSYFIIPSGKPHQYGSNLNAPWTIYWFHFSGKLGDRFIELYESDNPKPPGYIPFNEERLENFNTIYESLGRGFDASNLIFANMALWSLLSSFLFNSKLKLSKNASEIKDPLEQAISFLTENIHRNPSLEEMANSINLSRTYFSNYFRQKTGFSPKDYFSQMKIQRACQYLAFTDLRVKEIAEKLGIADPYYFSRLFKKIMNLSPQTYKTRYLQGSINKSAASF